jgi:hypothetical protein
MKISREMSQYVEDDDSSDFGGYWENTGKAEDGWKLWDCNKKEIDYWVCCDADDESIEGSNKGGEYYFKEIKCGRSNNIVAVCDRDRGGCGCTNPRPDGTRHPDRLQLGELNFMGKDENGKIVIGEHPRLNFANRNPAFVAIQIAQAVVAKKNRNLINTNYGKANIKPEFYEMVSELVGEMPVQIASEYAGDYL